MAELATIARPYAEALFQADRSDEVVAQVAMLADVSQDPVLQHFADNPKATTDLVFNVVADVLARKSIILLPTVQNFLRTVLDNGRLAALPAMAAQYQALINAQSGVSDAVVHSAFPIDDAQLAELVASLERRFKRKLQARVEIDPELIGGIRAVVGDEVLDTSVKARLEQMRMALTA